MILQGLDDETIHWHPDRTAPVRIPAEKTGVRLSGLILDFHRDAVEVKAIRILSMCSQDGAHADVGQEFGFVEQPLKQRFHAMAA
jgi:hypothetical protein